MLHLARDMVHAMCMYTATYQMGGSRAAMIYFGPLLYFAYGLGTLVP